MRVRRMEEEVGRKMSLARNLAPTNERGIPSPSAVKHALLTQACPVLGDLARALHLIGRERVVAGDGGHRDRWLWLCAL